MGWYIEKNGSLAEILIVEDNPGDARLFQEYLSEADITNPIAHVSTADQALDYVHQRGEFADQAVPDIVFLDWRLPTATGDEIIRRLPDESGPDIFTIVLTGSMQDPDSIVPADLGVDGFMTKPLDTDELISLVRSSQTLSLIERKA
ncbi:response regulator [Natronomonas salina]|uniref:response regulator n=1 Tax=Natronomonas salina TaxID=1710540 RepID=UPI0015B58503|nr:response regulator [Natronomonas salina]QLD89543.1 response regulator [Natronomonas salina]